MGVPSIRNETNRHNDNVGTSFFRSNDLSAIKGSINIMFLYGCPVTSIRSLNVRYSLSQVLSSQTYQIIQNDPQ